MKIQLKKKKDLNPLLQDNKYLTECLSKIMMEISEKEKKIERLKKVFLFCFCFKLFKVSVAWV